MNSMKKRKLLVKSTKSYKDSTNKRWKSITGCAEKVLRKRSLKSKRSEAESEEKRRKRRIKSRNRSRIENMEMKLTWPRSKG